MTDYDRLLGEILDRGPSSETLGLVLGELKKLGQTRKVIQECIRALRHHPDDLPLRLILAEACFEEGLLSQAEAEIETVTSQMDRYASAYRLQAEIYGAQKRREEALRSLKAYLALRPQDEKALALLKEMEIPKAAAVPEAAPAPEEMAEPAPVKAEEPRAFEPDERLSVEEEKPELKFDEEVLSEIVTPTLEEMVGPAPVKAEELRAFEPDERLSVEEEKPELAFDEEMLSEIATPTLAEVYVHQGQIQEALSVYEKVMAQNPADQASMTRIEELRTLLEAETSLEEHELPALEAEPPLPESELPPPAEAAPGATQKKQKAIAILESWLAKIRKMSEDSIPA